MRAVNSLADQDRFTLLFF